MSATRTLLVANRGEIAVRIMASAAALGLRTVAVHPADDAETAHVARADEAVELPGAGAPAYMDVDAVVDAAVRTGSDLLHPGYGFLSESPHLARRCADAGVTFVGPSPEALALFADKTAARARAVELGVPVPAGASASDAHALLAAHGAVMVKARAGGGGRGMQPVTDPAALDEALRRCASEARSASGDPTVYVEALWPDARHIEVQVVGDGARAVALGDRDCSAQRRRQKLVEIAPAPALPDRLRGELRAVAVELVGAYRGLATVEYLVAGEDFAFLEVNPRLQVEHTVTEEVTGVDLVAIGLRLAGGATLESVGLGVPVPSRGMAIEVRVTTEVVEADGTVVPSVGTLTRFGPPTGRGVRVDTHGYAGYAVTSRYDSLLAKVIVHGDPGSVAGRADRALAELDLAGVATNRGLLRAILADPRLTEGGLHTGWIDGHVGELLASAPPDPVVPARPGGAPGGEGGGASRGQGGAAPGAGGVALGAGGGASGVGGVAHGEGGVVARQPGVVVSVAVADGDVVAAGGELLVLEAMKMEHVVRSDRSGRVQGLVVGVGDVVTPGDLLLVVAGDGGGRLADGAPPAIDPDHVRPDLAEVLARHEALLDSARPAAVERRRSRRQRTARENVADLVDPASFTEYGGLVVAAQRRRRSLEDLIAATPADGLVTGTATVDGVPVAVLAYDYTVLAGTQGVHNHRKTDRLLELAHRHLLPLVVFAEGGGGRPGDTDTSAVAQLDVPTFRRMAELAGRVPTVAIVAGYCFAGNAALASVCDLIIATEDASLGMAGPAMIEGGGLGVVAPGDVGPMSVQVPNGVVDIVVPDEGAAVAAARRYLRTVAGGPAEPGCADQRALRHLVPGNRVRVYDVRAVLEVLFDSGSLLEVRAGFGAGIVTALARLEGQPVGVMGNDPAHLGGAIDGDAADKATRFLRLCDERRLPVVSLVDTPGFMVGPDAERTGAVRRFGAMFVAGAALSTPLAAVVLRKAYGLGAMAMAGGDLRAPVITLAWPTGEVGGMGLEGAVRLGFRRQLEAIADAAERRARYEQLVAEQYERGRALSAATVGELDDVIDPADTRRLLGRALDVARLRPPGRSPSGPS